MVCLITYIALPAPPDPLVGGTGSRYDFSMKVLQHYRKAKERPVEQAQFPLFSVCFFHDIQGSLQSRKKDLFLESFRTSGLFPRVRQAH